MIYIVDICDEVLEEVPEMVFGKGLLIVHFSVNVAVVQELAVSVLHLQTIIIIILGTT